MARGNYRGWSHSGLRQITKDNIGSLRLAWVWTMNDGGRRQRGDAARAQRHPLSLQHRQHHPGARCGNRRAPLGKSHPSFGRDRRRHRRDAQPRDLPGQALRRLDRRAYVRARCPHRPRRLGHPARQQREGLRQFLGPAHHQRQGGAGPRRLRALQGGAGRSGLLHQRARRADRADPLALRHGRARRTNGRRYLGQAPQHAARGRRHLDHRHLRSRSRSDLLGRRAGQTVDAGEPRHHRQRHRALHHATLALRPKTGQLAWFFQHAPGESLDLDEVYERVLVDVDGRKLSFNIGKVGILWKLDRARPASSSTPRKPSSRTSSPGRTRARACSNIAPTSSSSAPAIGSRPAPARPAARTGRR